MPWHEPQTCELRAWSRSAGCTMAKGSASSAAWRSGSGSLARRCCRSTCRLAGPWQASHEMPRSATRDSKRCAAWLGLGCGPVVWQRMQFMFQFSLLRSVCGSRMNRLLRGAQRWSWISHANGKPICRLPFMPGSQKTCMWCEPVTMLIRMCSASGSRPSGEALAASMLSMVVQYSSPRRCMVKRSP